MQIFLKPIDVLVRDVIGVELSSAYLGSLNALCKKSCKFPFEISNILHAKTKIRTRNYIAPNYGTISR